MPLRSIGGTALALLQSAALALWLEGLVTLTWTYPDCNYVLFGWPKPYRAYSECCSLEWNVDWAAYFFDIALYFLIASVIVILLRTLFRRDRWRLNFVFWILIVLAAIGSTFTLPLYHQIDFNQLYPMGQVRPNEVALWGKGYGQCPGMVNPP